MGVQKYDGGEHRRSDLNVKAAGVTVEGSAPQRSIDVPKGVQGFDDHANLRANQKVMNGADKPMPTSYNHDVPDGLQNFDDNGAKAGGTKYLGRE